MAKAGWLDNCQSSRLPSRHFATHNNVFQGHRYIRISPLSRFAKHCPIGEVMSTATETVTTAQVAESLCLVEGSQQLPGKVDSSDRVRQTFTLLEAKFVLQNDVSLVYPLTEEIQQLVARIYGEYDESYRFQLAISIEESVTNAMIHGNLEISSESRLSCDSLYYEVVSERMSQPPYCDRRAHVEAKLSRDQLILVVRDQGPGFDIDAVPDPTAAENLEKPCGRGLALMRSFMDAVVHNEIGNMVTMIKRPPKQSDR